MTADTAAALAALGTLVLAAAAVAGTTAAFLGLDTWKRQLNWQADHDLAKRSMLAIYKFRYSLYAVRHPAMSDLEMRLTEKERSEIVAGGERSAGVINAYANRWKRHTDVRSSLESLLLETDAVWGTQLRDLVQPLRELENELYSYIFLHIDAYLRGRTELAQSYREILRERRDILYDLLNAENDPFRRDFKGHLTEIEQYPGKKLGRKN